MFDNLTIFPANWNINFTLTVRRERSNKPGPLYVFFKETEPVSNNLVATIGFPPVTASDTASREFSYDIDGGEAVVKAYEITAPGPDLFTLPKNAMLHVSLIDIDASGNRSKPSEATVQALDKTAPPQPGAFTFQFDEEPEPTP